MFSNFVIKKDNSFLFYS